MKKIQTGKSFNDEQLRKALFAFQDLMERLTCPFFPLGKIAEQVHAEGKLAGDGIYVGIKITEFTDQRKSMFQTLLTQWNIELKETEKGYEFELEGVPIYLTIIKRNYKFFNNPEIRFFGVTEFLLPNPLNSYLKAQYLIQ